MGFLFTYVIIFCFCSRFFWVGAGGGVRNLCSIHCIRINTDCLIISYTLKINPELIISLLRPEDWRPKIAKYFTCGCFKQQAYRRTSKAPDGKGGVFSWRWKPITHWRGVISNQTGIIRFVWNKLTVRDRKSQKRVRVWSTPFQTYARLRRIWEGLDVALG